MSVYSNILKALYETDGDSWETQSQDRPEPDQEDSGKEDWNGTQSPPAGWGAAMMDLDDDLDYDAINEDEPEDDLPGECCGMPPSECGGSEQPNNRFGPNECGPSPSECGGWSSDCGGENKMPDTNGSLFEDFEFGEIDENGGFFCEGEYIEPAEADTTESDIHHDLERDDTVEDPKKFDAVPDMMHVNSGTEQVDVEDDGNGDWPEEI